MKVLNLLCVGVMVAGMVFAQVGGSIKTVVVEGSGQSREDAVAAALEKALLSQCGMSVSVTRHSQTLSAETNNDASISDSFKHAIETSAKGRIEGFNVVECEKEPDGKWNATVSVRIYGQYVLGSDPNLRRRMALAPFISKQKTTVLCGKEYQTGVVLDMLADRLAENLTQTRKFTMLDRKYDTEVEGELARLTSSNASVADYGRMNQKLATDYLLCAELTFFDAPAASTNPYNGITTRANTPLFSIAYRVLLAPTGQLKWADSLNVYPDAAMGGSADDALVNLMTFTAADISDAVMKNIIPMMVAEVGTDGSVILNEGGKSVSVGETLNVFSQGKEINDPFTHESLGREEILQGTIQVTKVLPKLSYAKIVSGTAANIQRGCLVRRPEQSGAREPVTSSAQGQGTIFRATPQGGVLSPFQQ